MHRLAKSVCLSLVIFIPLLFIHFLMRTETTLGHYAHGWYTQHLAGDKWDSNVIDLLLPAFILAFGLGRIWHPHGIKFLLATIVVVALVCLFLPIYYALTRNNVWWPPHLHDSFLKWLRFALYVILTSGAPALIGGVAGRSNSPQTVSRK